MGRIPNSLKEKIAEEEQSKNAHESQTSNSDSLSSTNSIIQPLKKRLVREYKPKEEAVCAIQCTQTNIKSEKIAFFNESCSLNIDFEMNIIRHFLLNAHERSMVDVHNKLAQAKVLVASGIKELQNNDFTLEDLWAGACQDIRSITRSLVILARDLPELKQYDISKLSDYVRSKLCNFFVVSHI